VYVWSFTFTLVGETMKPLTISLFDPDALRLGDIVLERGPGMSSAIVAAVTGGHYSHALIWVGGDFVEAMPGGVRSLSFARVPILNPTMWLLLRPTAAYQKLAERAAVEARGMAFKQYDTEGALRTVVGRRRDPVPTKLFCSQLIAEAYRRAGLELIPERRAGAITPNLLKRSP
jgi:uncharacterized protein YycO